MNRQLKKLWHGLCEGRIGLGVAGSLRVWRDAKSSAEEIFCFEIIATSKIENSAMESPSLFLPLSFPPSLPLTSIIHA